MRIILLFNSRVIIMTIFIDESIVPSFMQLPNEVQEIILLESRSAEMAQVCKAWHRITTSVDFTEKWLDKHRYSLGIDYLLKENDWNGLVSELKLKKLALRLLDRIEHFKSSFFEETKNRLQAEAFCCHTVFFSRFSEYDKANNLYLFGKSITVNEKGERVGILALFMSTDAFQSSSLKEKGRKIALFFEENKKEWLKFVAVVISKKGLTLIPQQFAYFPNIKKLLLPLNNISKLPRNFGCHWKDLAFLDLSCNKITQLPDSFGDSWPNLIYLNLAENSISSVSANFGKNWSKITAVLLGRNR